MTKLTKEQVTTRLRKVAQEAIKAAIGGDRQHGWGLNDSMEVIDVVVAEDASIAKEQGETYLSLSEEAASIVKEMINPSQMRQKLEGKLLDKAPTKAERVKGLLDGIE